MSHLQLKVVGTHEDDGIDTALDDGANHIDLALGSVLMAGLSDCLPHLDRCRGLDLAGHRERTRGAADETPARRATPSRVARRADFMPKLVAPYRMSGKRGTPARQLMQLMGVGQTTATAIVAMVGNGPEGRHRCDGHRSD